MTETVQFAEWRCAVYRYYDAAGSLLYVGSSTKPDLRWQAHKRSGAEWVQYVEHRRDEWFRSDEDAREGERWAILKEQPRHNKQFQMPAVGKAPEYDGYQPEGYFLVRWASPAERIMCGW